MEPEILTLAEIGEERWNGFVQASPLGTVYHHSAWHRVIEKTYNLRPFYVVVRDATGIRAAVPAVLLKAVFGKRLVSYPFSDVCGPLYDEPSCYEALISGLLRQRHEIRILEIRSKSAPAPEGFSSNGNYINYILPLDRTPEELFKGFHKDCVQRAVKKAFKSGLQVIEGSSLRQMKEFYGLHLMTRKRQGAPVQPFAFFRNIWEVLNPLGLITVLVVKYGKSAAAAQVVLKFKDTAYYKFGASDARYQKLGSNQLAMWTAIKKAADEGLKRFDFGRTYSGNTGLCEFKARWGALSSPLVYARYPAASESLRDEGGGVNMLLDGLFKKLPAFSNRIIGKLLYKYLA